MKTYGAVLSFVLTVLVICTTSCHRTIEEVVQPSTLSNDSLSIYTSFLRSLAFNKARIRFDKKTQKFIINDDMSTPLEDVRQRYAISQRQQGAKPAQYRWVYTVDQNTVHNVRVYIHPAVPTRWRTAAVQAIQYWNSISETNVVFRPIYSSAGANVTINVGAIYDSPNAAANSDLPYVNRTPGQLVLLNTIHSVYNSTDAALLKVIVTHELGHTIGLLHTDEDYGNPSHKDYANAYYIPGTPGPGQDPNSIMHSLASTAKYFTNGDEIAIRTLYPFTWDSLVERPWGDQEEGLGAIQVTWDNTVVYSGTTVKIEMYGLDNSLAYVAAWSAPNTGSFSFQPTSDLSSDNYHIKVSFNDGNPSHSDYTDNFFYYRAF